MKVNRIWCKDFLSFETVDYEVPQFPVRIQGINKTDKNQASNGSGKSCLQNIFEHAVLSSNSRKERDKGLIRRGTDSALTGIEIECPMRQQKLVIERTIRKSGTKLKLELNGEEVMFSNVKDGNEFILDWLKMSKEDITTYFIINNERFKSFFHNSNKEKLDLISRFTDTKEVDEASKEVKDELKELNQKLSTKETDRDKLLGRIEGVEEDLDKLLNTTEETNDVEINLYEQKNKRLESTIKDDEKSLKDREDTLERMKKSIQKLNDKVADLNEDYDEEGFELTADALNELLTEKSSLDREIIKLEAVCNGAVQCPECEHEFVLDPDADLIESRRTLVEKYDTLKDTERDVKETDEMLDEFKETKKKIDGLEKEVRAAERDLNNLERRINSLKSTIESNKRSVELNKAKIETLRKPVEKDTESERKSLELSKKELNEKLDVVKEELKKIEDEIFETSQWEINFKKFKMFMSKMSIGTIQAKTNAALSKMGSDLIVRIDGFKEKADGSFKEEITPVVIREYEAGFFSYSGGERGRLVFAMILAIQEIINEQNPYGGLHFLSVDEIFEGVDGLGLHHLMKSIRHIGQTVLITTHITDELLVDDNVLTIEKKEDISRIIKRGGEDE